MARVTVEDCIEVVPDRFELVAFAAHRTKKIVSGSPVLVNVDNDKHHVISLREIAEGKISYSKLKENYISSFRKYGRSDILESDESDQSDKTSEIDSEFSEIQSVSKEDLVNSEQLVEVDSESMSFEDEVDAKD